MKLRIQLDEMAEREVVIQNQDIFLDGKKMIFDVLLRGKDGYHVLKNGKSYHVEILRNENSPITVSINGKLYKVNIKNSLQLLLDKLGMSESLAPKIQEIKAPMPGLILKILVGKGSPIIPGEPILILEAMKMENIIKASSKGLVEDILVKPGHRVEKGQSLVILG